MNNLSHALARMARRPFFGATAAALALALIGLQACKKEGEKTSVLAQVGTSTLTLEELRESFPAEYEQLIRREQYLDFIKRWIDDEVIFQQALRSRLDDDPQIKRKVEKLRRKLLIEEFLSRENAAEVFEPDEMAMNQYYEMHKEEFRRKVPEFKYASIRVQSYKQAMDLRNRAVGDNFLALATANSLDPTPESIASIGFKKLTEIPPCLAQDVAATRIGAVTLPIACPDGVYLVKLVERQEAGSAIPFPEAKEEISSTLIMERKDKLMESRIAQYKEGMAISYNPDQIPGISENTTAQPTTAAQPTSEAPAAAHTPEVALRPAAPKPPAKPAAPATGAAGLPGSAAAQPASAAPAQPPAAAGALPREPWEIAPDAPLVKPKRRPLRRRPDSTAAAPVTPPAATETEPEKSNAQNPEEPQ